MPRLLLFGGMGQVGRALRRSAPSEWVVESHDVGETDIRDERAVRAAVGGARPDVIINCAAYTNVDGAESHADEARILNADAANNVARAAAAAGVRLIHLSTDYVFDGTTSSPYRPDSPTGPLNVYGRTKLAGEQCVRASAPKSTIVRTAWIHSGGASNFVATAVRHLTAGRAMRVVDDQVGTPTRAGELATALWHLANRSEVEGTLHFTDTGVASWFDVAVAVLETLRADGRLPSGASVTPIATADYPTPARRPAYSVLDKHDSWVSIGYVPPHWRDGVVASTYELLNA
ncbi:MAG TPA: dTDP-4-dehydrorhamnose reductase [Gemmatimonadaceae bacterium]